MEPYTIFFSLAFLFFMIALAIKFLKFGKTRKSKEKKDEGNVNKYGDGKGYILLDREDSTKNSEPDSWIPMIKVDEEDKRES